jgi:hypothetical protein
VHELLRQAASHPLIGGLIAAAVFEAATLIGRFGLGLRTADHLDTIKRLTFGVRIHHGVYGIALLAVWGGASLFQGVEWCALACVVGLGLLISDVVHHAVLKLVTGDPEFP